MFVITEKIVKHPVFRIYQPTHSTYPDVVFIS